MDVVVDERLILELKAVEKVINLFRVQLHGYLKANDLNLGLLLNFNVVRMTDGIERIVST